MCNVQSPSFSIFRSKAVADDSGVHTTLKTPVYHRPKDECGGGSAWACGILDVFMNKGLPSSGKSYKHQRTSGPQVPSRTQIQIPPLPFTILILPFHYRHQARVALRRPTSTLHRSSRPSSRPISLRVGGAQKNKKKTLSSSYNANFV